MATTYEEFDEGIRQRVFPEGEPAANLVANHRKWVLDGLIDLQKKVPCMQDDHLEIVDQCSTYYFCGTSVFSAPRGFLRKLYTIADGDGCTRIDYEAISKQEMDCLQSNLTQCATLLQPSGYYLDPTVGYVPFSDLPVPGWKNVDSTIDKPCRATKGFWTVDRGNIYVFPYMQWNEAACVEWDGIQRTFDDDEEVDFDREVEDAMEYYLAAKASEREDCDLQRSAVLTVSYNRRVAEMIHNCAKERRVPRDQPCFINCG